MVLVAGTVISEAALKRLRITVGPEQILSLAGTPLLPISNQGKLHYVGGNAAEDGSYSTMQGQTMEEKGAAQFWGTAIVKDVLAALQVPLWVFDGWQMESPRQREPGGAAPEDEPADEMSGAEMPAFFPDRDSGRTLRESTCNGGLGIVRLAGLIPSMQTCQLYRTVDPSDDTKKSEARIKRHNQLCDLLAEEAQKKGWLVFHESLLRDHQNKLYKPDLIFVKGDQVLVADISIRYDSKLLSLADAAAEKVKHKIFINCNRPFFLHFSLKTGFLKWKPDYDSAATEYGKAAVAFKNAKQFDQAREACLREAEAHENNKALFHAAKAYEQAGMMLKEMQRLPEAVQLIEKASMMYLENGTPDTAAIALERAGKLIENVSPEKAVQLYQQAASVFENEERLRQALEMLGKASRLLVRGRRLDEAALSLQKEKSIYKEIENYPTCYKKTIAQVLVHLHRNDYVAAERCVRESYSIPGFNGSEDCAALEQLLEGYDQQDQDQVSEVCNLPLFKYMDNDYAKLGLTLVVPGGGIKKKSPNAAQDKARGPATVGSHADEEEDEYSGGLC
nr:PREDICTED: LOW QUALITY PROTEIN: gamma-soluble NSF attachment protein [Opisthocomus hoazin]